MTKTKIAKRIKQNRNLYQWLDDFITNNNFSEVARERAILCKKHLIVANSLLVDVHNEIKDKDCEY